MREKFKTSEFIVGVAEQERKIRKAKMELKKLADRATSELCPYQFGDRMTLPDGAEMVVTKVDIVSPMFDTTWRFRISGRVSAPDSLNGSSISFRDVFVDFPET